MALPSVDDTPRDPTGEMLHRIVREHLQTFLAEATHLRAGEGVPRFVEEEFQAFLTCGWLPPHHAHSAWRGPRARRRVPGPARRRAEAGAGARAADRLPRRLARRSRSATPPSLIGPPPACLRRGPAGGAPGRRDAWAWGGSGAHGVVPGAGQCAWPRRPRGAAGRPAASSWPLCHGQNALSWGGQGRITAFCRPPPLRMFPCLSVAPASNRVSGLWHRVSLLPELENNRCMDLWTCRIIVLALACSPV